MLTKKQFAGMQDHSILGPHCPRDQVKKFCEEAVQYGFAAVYVNPCDVAYARSIVGDKVSVGTVIGFPQGASTTRNKIAEALDALDNGANELDVVINISRLKDGDTEYVKNELTEFTKAVKARNPKALVKVIIECYYLTRDEKITACKIVADSGCDYVKQSSGTTPNSSFNLGDIKLFNSVIGDRIKIKSSGWILGLEDVIGTIEFGASRVGNSIAPMWLEQFDDNVWYEGIKKLEEK